MLRIIIDNYFYFQSILRNLHWFACQLRYFHPQILMKIFILVGKNLQKMAFGTENLH